MNWLKENPFVSALVVILAAGCGAIGFLLSGAMATYSDTQAAYTQAVQKLHGLQNKAPFPDDANLKKASELRDEFRANLDSLRSKLSELQTPVIPSVTPQQFQDDLRAAVNDLTERAKTAGVGLPEGFYLGFDDYRATPPTDKAAPALARQLAQLVQVVGGLIGQNPENPVVRSIDSFSRERLGEEGGQPAEAAAPARRGNAAAGATAPGSIVKMPFTVGFTSEQGKFRIALNTLLKFPQFLVIRTLLIENSNPAGPPIAATENPEAANQTSAIFLASPDNPSASLNVLLGRELVKVQARMEIFDFKFPIAEKPEVPPAAN